jgi:thiol:disulfide interchange protein DsbD
MIPGMWGAPLSGLSGYLPPMQTQDFVLGANTGNAGVVVSANNNATSELPSTVKYGDFLELPLGLEGFFDLEEAKAYAAKVDKPIFFDFTGHGCVNCREMEARVWSDARVLDILRNEYVIVALYADDKLKVDEADWVTTDAGKVLKTLGKINSYYALKTYGVNAQPYYVLQGNEGTPMVTPRGYDLDVQGFIDFLQSGVEAYKAGK